MKPRVWRHNSATSVDGTSQELEFTIPWDCYVAAIRACGAATGSAIAPEAIGVQLLDDSGAPIHERVMPAALVAAPDDDQAGASWLWLKASRGETWKVNVQRLSGSSALERVDVGLLLSVKKPTGVA